MSRAYHTYVLAEGLSPQCVSDVKFLSRLKEKDNSANEINQKPMETIMFEIIKIKVTMKMRMIIK